MLLGLPAISPTRLLTGLALLIAALVLVVIALLRLIDTVHVALMMSLHPVTAGFVTTLIVLLFAAGLAVLGRVYLRPRPRRQNAAAAGAGAEMVAQLIGMVRKNPGTAAVGAAVLGALIGSTPELRRSFESIITPKPERRRDGGEDA